MMLLVQGGKGSSLPPNRPPRRPVPPCTPQQIAEAQRRLAILLGVRPEILQLIHAVCLETGIEQHDDRADALVAMFTGQWRHDDALVAVLSAWPDFPAHIRQGIQRLAAKNPDEYTIPRAIDDLIERVTPEQIADVAASINHRLASMRSRTPNEQHDDTTPARVRAMVDALSYMNAAQIAALAPVAAAMIDETPRRTGRLRAAVRGLLRHALNLDDWTALAVSAVQYIRRSTTPHE